MPIVHNPHSLLGAYSMVFTVYICNEDRPGLAMHSERCVAEYWAQQKLLCACDVLHFLALSAQSYSAADVPSSRLFSPSCLLSC